VSFEEAVRELEGFQQKTVSLRFRPVGWKGQLFEMHDEVDRVWTDEHGVAFVVFSSVESAVTLRPSQFVDATWEASTWPDGQAHPVLRLRANAMDIELESL